MEKVNILLVDDQPGKLLTYRTILSELRENFVSARSGREAMQFLLKQDCALILLDVVMPDMDGFETATLIRQHPRLERTPIIFVTAYSMSEFDRLKGYELGAVDYVFVPVVPEILRAKVSVFVELYRQRKELQNLNQTLKHTNAVMAVEIAERERMESALKEERVSLADRVDERTIALRETNEKLERAVRLKDEFLANMSHELRTPLNTILSISEALQEKIYGPLDGTQLTALNEIDESGRHLLALINDVLDLSKIEAGKLELEIVPVYVKLACQASLQFINQIALRKRLKISTTIDSAVTIIQADERHMKQILVNLLSNAIKFTPEDGEIGLEVVGNSDQEAVHITVWDTGIGIAHENLERLFQPFVQLDSSLARQYPGTGLGLALVYRLAHLHGGSISVESETGKGSRFTVSLPWRTDNAAGQKEADGPAAPSSERLPNGQTTKVSGQPSSISMSNREFRVDSPLILLAEDHESSIRTMSDYLSAKSYRVIVARNGSEAVEMAKEEHPELILMDIQMQGMDGLEATRRIRAEPALSKTPIIALTALAMRGDREKCLGAGVNDYMSKPVKLKMLLEMIETQLHK